VVQPIREHNWIISWSIQWSKGYQIVEVVLDIEWCSDHSGRSEWTTLSIEGGGSEVVVVVVGWE